MTLPFAKNAQDGTRLSFEDDGGTGAPVIFHGGIVDSVPVLRESPIARNLQAFPEFRLVYVDHRGVGRSDKPHDQNAYRMTMRVADATAVLDKLGIERAHFIGTSYGGRLCFGMGEHARDRVLSLVIGGQQPYALPDAPLGRAITESLAASRKQGSLEPFIQVLEASAGVRFPDPLRALYLANDATAIEAASNEMVAEGAVAQDLRRWKVHCLIFAGTGDAFYDLARRAAKEIPNGEFVSLDRLNHIKTHLQQDLVIDAIPHFLRENS